ncbi:MAG: protein kinase [Planctomycetes bacterium]|nr:protein kinase [Planctomycetota bacterium]
MESLWVWPFELEEKIGEGGMGVVYRARYVKNDRRVAVKLLPEDIADPMVLARFEREVRILKDLKHPNIVQSFGGVCEDKRRFYAMELVLGGTLDQLLVQKGGRFSWVQVVEYGLQMCAALQYAHDRGIIHRDVKPGNFLLTKEGKLKLSDFGLATVVAGSKLTSTGRTVGSFRFMSPEQIRGNEEPTPSTDLYSLGCVFCQLLTGTPPFNGTTAAELLNKHLNEAPPRVSALAPDCPLDLDRLVDDLLKKDIADRPGSAREVAKRLKSISLVTIVSGDTTKDDILKPRRPKKDSDTTRPLEPARPRRFFQPVTVALLLICAAAIAWSLLLLRSNRRLAESEKLWIESFKNTKNSNEVRAAAAVSLGKLGAKNTAIVELLEKSLRDKNPRIREYAAIALGNSGGNAKSSMSALKRLRNDKNTQVREAANQSLEKIRNADPPSSSTGYVIGIVIFFAVAGGVFYHFKRRARTDSSG